MPSSGIEADYWLLRQMFDYMSQPRKPVSRLLVVVEIMLTQMVVRMQGSPRPSSSFVASPKVQFSLEHILQEGTIIISYLRDLSQILTIHPKLCYLLTNILLI